jgi:hypothetical protein
LGESEEVVMREGKEGEMVINEWTGQVMLGVKVRKGCGE